ncbi:hypothetical protein HHI36_021265 [Cryptolaemus montrouzieri]|uniref:Uncharacterized protein n=1 Tax=Cryptolaemus montrouzieri TaxID=559131 RepID=A0ABD2MX29_9CUCU
MKYVVLFFEIFAIALAAKLPPNFKKCKINDQECLKNALQDALPNLKGGLSELGLPSLDPLYIPEMTIGAGQNVVQLTQKYKEANLYGAADSQIKSVDIDLKKNKIDVKFTFPLWTLNATYEVKGKILLLPVFGTGPCSLTLENGNADLTFNIETYKKKDQSYIRGTQGKMVVRIQRATYKFDNLFNGDKILGDNINNVLNENWREVYEEVAPGYGDVYSAAFMNIMNKIFSKVPLPELFLS